MTKDDKASLKRRYREAAKRFSEATKMLAKKEELHPAIVQHANGTAMTQGSIMYRLKDQMNKYGIPIPEAPRKKAS